MISPIDVIDSAVKIGLGALISGLATYWLAKVNHHKVLEKERAQRRREMLELIAQEVSNFDQTTSRYLRAVSGWLQFTPTSEPMSVDKRVELTKLEQEFEDGAKDVRSASAKLWLLGEIECRSLLKEYAASIRPYSLSDLAMRRASFEKLEEQMDGHLEKLTAFFVCLGEAYRRI